MEYAALDAAVLVRIFLHIRSPPNSPGRDEQSKGAWKSHIVSHESIPSHLGSQSICIMYIDLMPDLNLRTHAGFPSGQDEARKFT